MTASKPEVLGFHHMPGPHLHSDTPGVWLEIDWPEAALMAAGRLTQHAMTLIFASDGLRPFRPAPDAVATLCRSGGRQALDGTIALVAEAVIRASTRPVPGRTSKAADAGGIVVLHRDAALATFASRTALALMRIAFDDNALPAPAPGVASLVDQLLSDFRSHCRENGFGEASWRKFETAQRRDIPWRRLIATDRTVQLGHGRRQIKIKDSLSERDSSTGFYLSTHKNLANELLRANGLPAPTGMVVSHRSLALQAARVLGYPVVVKPVMTDYGTAVSVNLRTEDAIAAAFDEACRYGPVLVEQHVPGENFRLLVMHGKFLSAVRQDPAHVVGDGVHTIEQLVRAANSGRSEDISAVLKKIRVDADTSRVLRNQGLALDAIPAAGHKVLLREHSNLSVGGSFQNVTSLVHPDNRMLAERAAAVLGLTVAGVDFITTDITHSYLEGTGAICEVNVSPGFVMGEAGYGVEEAFLEGLFPDGGNGRIPIVALYCNRPIDELVARLEGIGAESGHVVVSATPRAIRSGGRTVASGRFSQLHAVGAALQDPVATMAIVQLTGAGTLREGLVFDRCALGAMLEQGVRTGSQVSAENSAVDARSFDLLRRHSERFLDAPDMATLETAVRELRA